MTTIPSVTGGLLDQIATLNNAIDDLRKYVVPDPQKADQIDGVAAAIEKLARAYGHLVPLLEGSDD